MNHLLNKNIESQHLTFNTYSFSTDANSSDNCCYGDQNANVNNNCQWDINGGGSPSFAIVAKSKFSSKTVKHSQRLL